VTRPNTAWVTDMTHLWTPQGWLYLAVIIDLFLRRVVGWANELIVSWHWTRYAWPWRNAVRHVA
jgi:transposase InsO family protein